MKYWPVHLHMHSVWERQASMEGHFYNAQKLGADVYLYGHGPTGDTHSFYKEEDGKVYANSYFAPAVFMDNGEYAEIKNYGGRFHR